MPSKLAFNSGIVNKKNRNMLVYCVMQMGSYEAPLWRA